MLKKISHIIFAMFFLVPTTGMTLSMHYCGGELVSTSINKEAKSCCDGTGGCCQTQNIHFEVASDYLNLHTVESHSIAELDILFPIVYILNAKLELVENNAEMYMADTSPPPTIQTRLSLLQTYLC